MNYHSDMIVSVDILGIQMVAEEKSVLCYQSVNDSFNSFMEHRKEFQRVQHVKNLKIKSKN